MYVYMSYMYVCVYIHAYILAGVLGQCTASLAGVLGQCTALTHLDLSRNRIGDAGAQRLKE
jgi:hypothetical protein